MRPSRGCVFRGIRNERSPPKTSPDLLQGGDYAWTEGAEYGVHIVHFVACRQFVHRYAHPPRSGTAQRRSIMTIAELIPLVIQTSILVLVFALGLHATLEDVIYLFRRPGLLVRVLLAMGVVVPFVVAVLAAVFGFFRAVGIGFFF